MTSVFPVRFVVLAGALLAGPTLLAQTPASSAPVDSQALPRMIATERAFAAATAEIGVRDGFLTFFADDAISLDAGPVGSPARIGHAKDALRALAAAKLPVLTQLMWQPFTGQISEDGTLGWLTGPYVSLSQLTKDITAQGAYFSVWKRQADGTFRVWLDEGVALPQVWSGASDFHPAPPADAGTVGVSGESLDEAERAVASGGTSWTARLAASMRLHREGLMPVSGRDQATAWASNAWASVHYAVVDAERAASGDLGVALGGYDATTAAGAERGTWVRVWQRDLSNRWRIVFETSKRAK